MASNSISNVPYFFKGTYDQLKTALSSGGKFYPLTKAGWAFVTDRNCMAYCDTDGSIVLVGDTTENVQTETGTTTDPIILDELKAGVYSVTGAYQITATEAVKTTDATQLFIVADDGTVSQFTGDTMTRQVLDSTGKVVTETYTTDAEIVRSLASDTDIKNLFS